MSQRRPFIPASFRRPWRPVARGVTWLVIVALLGLLAMPMVDVVDPTGDILAALCTEGGSGAPPLADDGHRLPAPTPHSGQTCPFCLAHAGGFTLPSPVAVPSEPVAFVAAHRPVLLAGIRPKAFFRTGCQSRAPPLVTV
jgi:hypothetical protein